MASIIKYSPKVIGEILNIVHNAVFLLDTRKQIIFANTQMEKMFKAKPEQLVGLEFERLFMPDDQEILVPNVLKITQKKGEFEFETMLRGLDGSSFLGLMSCAIFQWDGETFIATTIHDITKMKSIERMLKHSEHEAFLGHMLNDISHHIRNPVLVIAGLTKRLRKSDPTQKYTEAIAKESSRLEKLLDTLNAFIQLPRPRLQQTSLTQIVEAVEAHVKPISEKFGVQWNWKHSEHILVQTILVDLSLFIEAIKAVVLNACESYVKENDKKVVTLQLIETFEPLWPYAVRIIDQGCGINPDDLPYITSHFFTNKSKHIGMGLTFARRILEEQDGELTIDSSAGQGTTVIFYLKKERRRPIRTTKMQ